VSTAASFALPGGRELRLLREEDADELYALVDANREHLGRWMQWVAAQTPQRTLERIRENRAQHEAGNGFNGAIVDAGRIVGVAGMQPIDWANSAVELGYWLAREAEGAGLMAAAVRALTDHAFDDLGLRRVQVCTAVHNERSRALVQRLGFEFEGVARQHYRLGDEWHDDAIYAMVAPDRARDREARGASLSAGEP
jgi:ribosomal-protein-serine acetyltransferase